MITQDQIKRPDYPRPVVPGRARRRVISWPKFLSAYVVLHGIWLVLYALLGKGFAYAGFPPLYVGEMLLVLAGFCLLSARRTIHLFTTPTGLVLGIFIAWQVTCTIPYLGTYGRDALRDGALWGYALFACTAAALTIRLPGFLSAIVATYGRFARLYLFAGPAALLATLYLRDWLPSWPDTNVSIPLIKGGEMCVHLAGILAFITVGLSRFSQWWLFLVVADVLLGMNVRGGLLAFIVASFFVLLLRPKLERFAIIVVSSALLVLTMEAVDLRIAASGTKEFSLARLSNSVISTVTSSDQRVLESTKAWRLTWWSKIWTYTVNGPYFWTGKGYGINLANSDGFQVGAQDEPLRSPHSSHMTILARSGVPGFIMWIVLQVTWAGSVLVSYLRARRVAARDWSSLFAWILAYWIAFVVCAGFDVFLEGPMAGIPFWTLFGIGWGAQILFRSQLEANPNFVTGV